MTIKVDDQACGPWCHPTSIVEVRSGGVVLRDLIAEAIWLIGGGKVRKQFIGEAGACAVNHLPMLAGWLGRFATPLRANTARRISTVV